MSGNSVEERVNDVISDLLRSHAVEEAFCNIIVHNEETDAWNSKYNGEKLRKVWQTIPQEAQDIGLRIFVDVLHRQCNASRVTLLCDLLESMVENGVIAPRSICDALLSHDGLSYNKPLLWNATFKLIRKIVGGVDYKGVRDLLRVILDKLQNSIPSDNVAVLPEVEVVTEVVTYILDRNACLLPAYLAINEITKVSADTSSWPQWSMGRMLSSFVDSFRPAAQMVSIAGRSHLLPVVGHSMSMNNVWRLNTTTLRFHLSGPLPYDKAIQDPQTGLLRYVLEQPYSREMVCNMLGLNKQAKQRCEVLEDQLVDLVVVAMERSESEAVDDPGLSQLLWQHLSSQLIYFVLFQFASFPHMVMSLYEKLQGKNLKKGRDHLMWVLLQFISGSIQKNPGNRQQDMLADFLPVMRLYDLLYSDDQVIPMPEVSKPQSTHALASTCIWIHLNKKAESDKQRLQRPIPYGLRQHLEFLRQTFNNNSNLSLNDYKIALLCNAYSTNTEYFSLPMGKLLESVYGNNKNTTLLPGNIVSSAPTQPLSMSLLDSLTVHAKMSLIHSIVTRVIRLAKNKSNISLAPALVETYSRLLVYMEIESLGIKGFISQLLPTVFNSHALGILHTLLEMFSYRLHHTQIHYRIQLLGHLHTLATIQQTNQNQLHLCVESTALRLIISLGSYEVQPQLTRISNESKSQSFLAGESEELNRALVLTLARSVHITGLDNYSNSWCKEILMSIKQNTPLSWPSYTMQYFPPVLEDFFNQNPVPKEDKSQLKRNVETEYKKWKSMVNENDLIAHFSMQGNAPLFLCIIWKSLLDENRVSPTAYKVLDRLGPRALSAHLRAFADYLVFEFTTVTNPNINRYMDALNEMIWRSNIITIDRLILCLILRNLEGNEAQMRCLIVQLLLVHLTDFKSRVHDFVKDNTPEHWQQANWHEKHMAFHKKYPEKFYYEGIQDMSNPIHHQHLPVYFGNVCLRFLPVLDVTIHRLLEFQKVQKILESILDQIGCLYKFHDRPVTYLYNTLFYYEKRLAGKSGLKRRLVHGIIGAFKDIRPPNWCLSEDYTRLLQMSADDMSWTPDQDYYVRLIGRLVDTIGGKIPPPFPNCDWRFNEFPNPAAHALHATCVELMALPVGSTIVGNALLDVALKSCFQLPRDKIMSWMNAVGLVLTALPEPFWVVLNDRVVDAFNSSSLATASYKYPFQMFNFHSSHIVFAEQHCSYLLGLCHAIWHHAGIGQLCQLPQFLKERLKPIIRTEEQYLYLCHLIGPFLQRLHVERTRCLLELTVELYEILMTVDKSCEHLNFMDPICDFLYHIKYMFIGDGVKHDVEKVIRNLRPALQLRLRFISHINVEEPVSA